MEIVKVCDSYQVWDYNGFVEFEGTEIECEDYISDNQEEDEYEHDFEDALEN